MYSAWCNTVAKVSVLLSVKAEDEKQASERMLAMVEDEEQVTKMPWSIFSIYPKYSKLGKLELDPEYEEEIKERQRTIWLPGDPMVGTRRGAA
jgi:hypothetical protein